MIATCGTYSRDSTATYWSNTSTVASSDDYTTVVYVQVDPPVTEEPAEKPEPVGEENLRDWPFEYPFFPATQPITERGRQCGELARPPPGARAAFGPLSSGRRRQIRYT